MRMRNQVDLGHQYNTIADLMYILFVLQENKRIHGDSMHDTCAVNVLKFGLHAPGSAGRSQIKSNGESEIEIIPSTSGVVLKSISNRGHHCEDGSEPAASSPHRK